MTPRAGTTTPAHSRAPTSTVAARSGTPRAALLANLLLGSVAVLSGRTADLITLSVLGALLMYVLAMAALFRLRVREPGLSRPYRAPLYPWLPGFAFGAALVCLLAVAFSAPATALVFVTLLALASLLRVRDRPDAV